MCFVISFGIALALLFLAVMVWWQVGAPLPPSPFFWRKHMDDSYPCEAYRASVPLIEALVNAAWRCVHDHNGRVDVSGLASCQELAPTLLQKLQRGDQDENGELDIDEFQAALRKGRPDLVDMVFRATDVNGDGMVNHGELQAAEHRRILPDTLVSLLRRDEHRGEALGRAEFLRVARPSMQGVQGKEEDFAKEAWAILDGNDRGFVTKDHLQRASVWANLQPEALQRFLPPRSAVLTELDFMAKASFPAVAWTEEQRQWCCKDRGICFGARLSAPLRTVEQHEYHDCDAGYREWQKLWDYPKQLWCCSHHGRGCPSWTAPPGSNFDCSEGFSHWKSGWSEEKKSWCCRHQHRGCDYDCFHGGETWKVDWTSGKKAWCCSNTGIGCPAPSTTAVTTTTTTTTTTSTTTTTTFDCQVGRSSFSSTWSKSKQAWCCDHHHVACAPFNCSFGPNGLAAWSQHEKAWCCVHQQLGCPSSSDPEDFDCSVGLHQWRSQWSQGKKEWCCHHYQRGCDYDCSAGLLQWQTGWSDNKKAWCCQQTGKGCPGYVPGTRFDCSEGAYQGWHQEKKDWCCKHEHAGCADDATYDCSHGFKNWRHAWTSEKKSWCCRHDGRGCEHDCSLDVSDWQTRWSSSQKIWCCNHVGVGCER